MCDIFSDAVGYENHSVQFLKWQMTNDKWKMENDHLCNLWIFCQWTKLTVQQYPLRGVQAATPFAERTEST